MSQAKLEIEFEEEKEGTKTGASQKPSEHHHHEDVELEFSASTEIKKILKEEEEKVEYEKEQKELLEKLSDTGDLVIEPSGNKMSEEKLIQETAQVHSLEEARQVKKPVAAVAQKTLPKQTTTQLSPLSSAATKIESVKDADLRVARAESKGETMAFYLSEAKLLEYQVMSLLKRLAIKSPEGQKIIQQVQKYLSEHTKKKPNF